MATQRQESYEKRLDKLKRLLSRARPLTADELAERLGCSKATVYNHLEALAERGVSFETDAKRKGARGPLSTALRIAR